MATSLLKKLPFIAGQKVVVLADMAGFVLPDGLDQLTVLRKPETGPHEGVLLFVTSRAALSALLAQVFPFLLPETIIWIAYPKKSAGTITDLSMARHWEELDPYRLEPCAAISIDEVWTGIRLKPADQIRRKPAAGEAAADDEQHAYIDRESRAVRLPPRLQVVLEQHPPALEFYYGLSFTNKKEYVQWLLEAKREATQEARLVQIRDKLLAGKRNPTEK